MYYCQYIWQYTLTIFQREESKYDITQRYICLYVTVVAKMIRTLVLSAAKKIVLS